MLALSMLASSSSNKNASPVCVHYRHEPILARTCDIIKQYLQAWKDSVALTRVPRPLGKLVDKHAKAGQERLDVEMHETIKNGQLLPRNMFSNEENYIISIENNIVAIYKPFNEKYYKPEKVLV